MGQINGRQAIWMSLWIIGLGGCQIFPVPSQPSPTPQVSPPASGAVSASPQTSDRPSPDQPTRDQMTQPIPDAVSDLPASGGRDRSIQGVEMVDFQSIGELQISQGSSESLRIEAPDDVLAKLTSEVRDGRLVLGVKPNQVIESPTQIRYWLTVKTLKGLQLSGAGNVSVDRLNTPSLEVSLQGTGEVQISGTADRQRVVIRGASNYQADQLQTQQTIVSIQGTGAATVSARDRLDAEISGAGSVEYVGQPAIVNQSINGVGTIRSR